MTGKFLALIMILAFCADCALYGMSKFPERSYHWYSYLPGSGYITIILDGREQ